VGELARNNLREADEVARWGGEEFLALLPQTGLQGAADWAERLRERAAAAEPYGVDDLTLSFGVAEYRPGESLAMLIKRADDALYEAKAAGRNRVAVASEE
jgi:diguanylate cyclase (GGDEF)-like protein